MSATQKPQETTFDFPTAISKIKEGKSVSKKEWEDKNIKILMDLGRLVITLPQFGYLPRDFIITEGDLLGEDFFIVK